MHVDLMDSHLTDHCQTYVMYTTILATYSIEDFHSFSESQNHVSLCVIDKPKEMSYTSNELPFLFVFKQVDLMYRRFLIYVDLKF